MRRLVVNLDNTLDDWLKGEVNQNETVRKALYLYKSDIATPDTLQGLQQSYTKLAKYMKSKFEVYDESFERMDKLINLIESKLEY